MNTKRWVAVGLALVILIVGAGMGSMKSKVTKEEDMQQVEDLLNRWMPDFDKNTVNESIVTNGNPEKRIALLSVEGAIMGGGNALLSDGGYNHTFFMDSLDTILHDSTISGVLLYVNSPGGGTYESAEIHKKIKKIAEVMPVYVVMANVAASGGYYISAPAEKIFASPETITGSIGVIMKSTNFTGLMEKYGVKEEVIKSGPHKDILSSSRAMTDEERDILQSMLNNSYERFVKVVAEGRHMDVNAVKKIADGRIYDGVQAKEIGLVDELGNQEDALNALIADHDLADAEIIEYKPSIPSIDNLFGRFFISNDPMKEAKALLKELQIHSGMQMMYLYGGM